MINLENICETCGGLGQVDMDMPNSAPRKVICSECRGTGEVPSDIGQELIDFVVKYIGADYMRLRKR